MYIQYVYMSKCMPQSHGTQIKAAISRSSASTTTCKARLCIHTYIGNWTFFMGSDAVVIVKLDCLELSGEVFLNKSMFSLHLFNFSFRLWHKRMTGKKKKKNRSKKCDLLSMRFSFLWDYICLCVSEMCACVEDKQKILRFATTAVSAGAKEHSSTNASVSHS